MAALEFENKVVSCIVEGDLDSLKKCCLGSSDVSRPLRLVGEVKIVNNSKKCPFSVIQDPTPLILSILCEQIEILEYFLIHKRPDLSVRVNGWAPIHYAACIGDFKCLQQLLKYEFIQENIDMPIVEPFAVPEGRYTTALHVAVTNKRHAQAILLTQDLPPIQYTSGGDVIDSNSPVLDDSDHQPANASQLSAHGNSPLHIAARQNDWDMCQILLHVIADSNLMNDSGKTAANVALDRNLEELSTKIEKGELEPIEVLTSKYLSPKKDDSKNPVTNQTNDNNQQTIVELQQQIKQLTQIVQSLMIRVGNMESNKGSNKTKTINPCEECGSLEAEFNPRLQLFLCKSCLEKK